MEAAPEPLIACTLSAPAMETRLGWIRRVTGEYLLAHRIEEASLQLIYRPEAKPELERIVAAERECCAFLRFQLEDVQHGVRLNIQAPDGVGANARWLFDQFLPTSRLALATKGCGCETGACG